MIYTFKLIPATDFSQSVQLLELVVLIAASATLSRHVQRRDIKQSDVGDSKGHQSQPHWGLLLQGLKSAGAGRQQPSQAKSQT